MLALLGVVFFKSYAASHLKKMSRIHFHADCRNAECPNAKRGCAECRGTAGRGSMSRLKPIILNHDFDETIKLKSPRARTIKLFAAVIVIRWSVCHCPVTSRLGGTTKSKVVQLRGYTLKDTSHARKY